MSHSIFNKIRNTNDAATKHRYETTKKILKAEVSMYSLTYAVPRWAKKSGWDREGKTFVSKVISRLGKFQDWANFKKIADTEFRIPCTSSYIGTAM